MSFGLYADVIRIAHQNDYYPYSYVDEQGEPAGVFIDWWELWAQKTGREVLYIPADYEKCIDLVEEGRADVVAGLFMKPEFVNQFRFAGSIIKLRTLVVLQDGYNPVSFDVFDRPVGVIANEISQDIINEQYAKLPVTDYNSFKDLREVVRNNKIAGYVYEYPIPAPGTEQVVFPDGYYEYKVIREEEIRPAVKIGNDDLMELVLNGSRMMTEDELYEIRHKYGFIKPLKSNTLPILIGGLVAAVIAGWWYATTIKKRARKIDEYSPNDWKVIIDKGENDQIEFKSSLRWDYNQEKVNKVLEQVIAKSISAFLNTDGGMLFIGVNDNGEILGLDSDYQSMSKKSRDGFLLTLTSVVNAHLGKQWHKYLSINMISINDKDICIVNIDKAPEPAFLEKKGNEEFYIRTSASSQPLGLKEAYQYITSHFSKQRN